MESTAELKRDSTNRSGCLSLADCQEGPKGLGYYTLGLSCWLEGPSYTKKGITCLPQIVSKDGLAGAPTALDSSLGKMIQIIRSGSYLRLI